MKALLICPAERPEISALAESAPLMNLPVLGKPFIYHWLDYFAARGLKEIKVLAADRPDQVRNIIGNGARWGLDIEVLPETHELTEEEARSKYSTDTSQTAVVLADVLPQFREEKLFAGYSAFFSALETHLAYFSAAGEIGMKEIKPGVWVGMRSQISPRAELHAPCWIGENVLVNADAVIGPNAYLENGVVVENGATIYDSWVGSQTFVGDFVQVKDSLAVGNTLVNLRLQSIAKVPDEFLLCALEHRDIPTHSGNWFGRLAAFAALTVTAPFALVTIARARAQGQRALLARRAATAPSSAAPSVSYFEFANATGWWKRWPQLWNVARGDFAWIGNRPLSPMQAEKLFNEFEKLWLAGPIGLISQCDAEGCSDLGSDEARAHSSFYSVRANWRLDASIFLRAMIRLLQRKSPGNSLAEEPEINSRAINLSRVIIR